MQRQTWHFSGRVQGVGFRARTADIASETAVTGTVENLPDGRVRVIAQGSASELAGLLRQIQLQLARYIVQTEITTEQELKPYDDFSIRY